MSSDHPVLNVQWDTSDGAFMDLFVKFIMVLISVFFLQNASFLQHGFQFVMAGIIGGYIIADFMIALNHFFMDNYGKENSGVEHHKLGKK